VRNNPLRSAVGVASALALALVAAACAGLEAPAPKPPAAAGEAARDLYLEPVPFRDLIGWQADDLGEGLDAFLQSCSWVARQADGRPLGYEAQHGTMADLKAFCRDAAALQGRDALQVRYFLESRLQPYQVRAVNNAVGTFTGYYEPLLRGAWKPDVRYRFPAYARPHDLVVVDLEKFDPERKGEQLTGRLENNHLLPFFDRRQIEQGALNGRQLELLWLDDPIDLFFLHIQGSGRVRLPDGSDVRLAFAARNGHRYTPIGRELVAMGVMKPEEVSLQSLRAWLAANPLAGREVMMKNRAFIFFRVEKEDAVKGALGTPLTGGRSLAVDPKFIPLGLPLWLVTTDPLDPKDQTPLRRMVTAQDTGSAIKGIVRGDLFWGFGQEAELRAGKMNEKGSYYVLLPRRPAS